MEKINLFCKMHSLNKKTIKNIVKSIFENIDFSDIYNKLNVRENGVTFEDVNKGITLYHRPMNGYVDVGNKHISVIDSIFKYGFNREFTGQNGGNMYGAGVYTVYNLKSSNEKARGYGNAIIKIKLLGGYKDFLIFSEQLAKQTYGNR